jgi:hypothetical protein
MHRSTPSALAVGLALAVVAGPAAAAVPLRSGAADSAPVTATNVRGIRLVALSGHHDGDTARAPFYGVFSTDAPLRRTRDDEGVLRYPGGVGVAGPAGMTTYRVAGTGGPSKGRWCYAAEASSSVWRRLRVGRKYPVQVAVSNDRSAPRAKRRVTVRRTTIRAAARSIGC